MLLAMMVATAFNLHCTGRERVFSDGKREERPYERVIRVDLERMRWCDRDCAESYPIVRASAEDIVFQEDRVAEVVMAVNRETGSLISFMRGKIGWYITGQCKPAPFTGLPERRF